MDEITPYIHATLVPIVKGEKRKVKTAQQQTGKKMYKKKNPENARLCADDVMNHAKLKHYQGSYAERMQYYGLEQGIKGSEAKHISTPQYYRELFAQNEGLKENIEYLQEEKQEIYEKVRDLYDWKNEARKKFLDMHEYTQQKE